MTLYNIENALNKEVIGIRNIDQSFGEVMSVYSFSKIMRNELKLNFGK